MNEVDTKGKMTEEEIEEEFNVFSVNMRKIEGNNYEEIIRLNPAFENVEQEKLSQIANTISNCRAKIQQILKED